MSDYKAPLRDMQFVLHEVFKASDFWADIPALAETVDRDTSQAILQEAAKITEVIAALNREADEFGSRLENGKVTVPAGFQDAYTTLSDGGWLGLGGSTQHGGMGMPKMLTMQYEEMLQSGSLAFGLLPMLTAGACTCLNEHATEALKALYLPNLYSGRWAATMDMTEAHAGSDLGLMRTRAVPSADGSYSITGSKIFITWGEHELAENIVHLVLAKLPDAPAGSRGISLFLVPKILVNDDGTLGEQNLFSCGALEKKMGIKASPTCVMNFDGAKGWLIGEPNKGLAAMFTMMNYERLGVGVQGLSVAERSLQNAITYAKERLQSRSPAGAVNPAGIADPIIAHADVRRMLLIMRSLVEGGRAFSTYVAKWLDVQKFSDDKTLCERAEQRVALLTPVAKAFVTDRGLEASILGQQVFGGHGYIREWGQEQCVRDVRITQIYEGTNGIQAMDLIARKVISNKGLWIADFCVEIREAIGLAKSTGNQGLIDYAALLEAALLQLERVTEKVVATSDPHGPGAAAVDYLDLLGYCAYGYMWLLMAQVAEAQLTTADADFYQAKLAVANFYFRKVLPRTRSLALQIEAGHEAVMSLDDGLF